MPSVRKLALLCVTLLMLSGGHLVAQDVPDIVNVPGTIQPALGCPGEWAPDCEATFLEYVAAYDIWERTFENLPAASYEYKVAIDGTWDENYGGFADPGGPNISLVQPQDGPITFLYDHETNWIMDTTRQRIVTAPGSYQSEVGCAADWLPDCMITWLQDVDGDGIYTYTTSDIPAGDYEAKAAINRTWDENYGVDGAADGANIPFNVPEDGTDVTFTFDSNLNIMVISTGGGAVSAGSLRQRTAHWLTQETLGWEIEADPEASYQLLYSLDAGIEVSLFGLAGTYETLALRVDEGGLSDDILEKFPHLAGLTAFTVADEDVERVPEALTGQIAIAEFKGDDLTNLAGLQIPGVLDDLYTTDVPLGLTFDEGVPTLTVWAPTAQSVRLNLYADSTPRLAPQVFEMARDDASGTWSITGDAAWYGQFYTYTVDVFVPTEGAIVANEVTDPYSVSLSQNSIRSQIIDLNDPDYMPQGWAALEKPALDAFEDISLYELHIRDFSIFDERVPEALRGTYLAFAQEETHGSVHLARLAAAGLTHVHLLPSFDIATINENRERWFAPDYDELASFAPDSDQQQAAIEPIRDLDGFNWGYDPYHFNVPEGSYSTDPDGAARILEYRQMVQALNEAGLRVVQDVVYNHTNASGQANRSVLDKVVPGYYHRLNGLGQVETSTCCQNTATEHNMMRRLMVDSVVLYATQYKIDGFRFDLMGHHMVADMQAVREALDSLTLEAHGVDGSLIYVYGEGWNFGEVVNGARGVNATQLNVGGLGIGTFNDRLRDAVRGGNPFGDQLQQGFSNGSSVYPNGLDESNDDVNRALLYADQIRIGLAANLRDYTFVDRSGNTVTGADVDYGGSPAGYTLDPQEHIIYVSAHDNETLYDAIAYKAPREIDMRTRVQMQLVALSTVTYAQGVPFFHAGSEILRSKSMDRNSYNSGDWFNRLDFTYQTNNFGVGLPPAADNRSAWDLMRPLLADESLQPDEDAIMLSLNAFEEMLRVRYSSPLFRLRSAEAVQARVAFHNTGADQIPGLIVMSLDDTVGDDLDPNYAAVVVVFNARPEATTYALDAFEGDFALHPILAASSSDLYLEASADGGSFNIPAWTTAVFVLPQG